jgi:murein L,D-transpeptidase YcbB/YkuD
MRVVKNGETIHQEKIVVGKIETQTPIFSADMKEVIFHPDWGVPDSIKVNELWPSLRRSSGGFFGYGGADTRVLERHNLRVSYNGRPVEPSMVDWNSVDIRRFTFIQPAGAGNVLGVLKFRFPNRHDVYMHDTPQRELFSQSRRTFSHGCMRVQNPRRLAEVLLGEDQGMSAAQVGNLLARGEQADVQLRRKIPVHVVYFTAVANEHGKLETFPDVYGHDRRLAAALDGRPLPVVEPREEMSEAVPPPPREVRRGGRTRIRDTGDPLSNLVSGLLAN